MKIFKSTLITIGLLALTVLTSITANASFLVEPHLAYAISGNSTAITSDAKYSGAQYGARFGIQNFGLMAGVDYTHSSLTFKQGLSSSDHSKEDLGLFVGYSAPLFLRAWLGYYFSSKQTPSGSSTYYKGHTTEVGVGFSAMPLLSLNLVYRMVAFDEYYNGSSTSAMKYEPKEIVLGVSLPFTLL